MAPLGYVGYGVVGYNILKALLEKDWDISLFPKSSNHGRSGDEAAIIFSAQSNSQFFDYNAPCLNIWHQHDLYYRVGKGKYFAWPIFELDRFNEVEKHNLNYPDHLIVCSNWARDVCKSNDITVPVSVVPLGVDIDIFNPTIYEQHEGTTIFLNVGKWEIRKGHDILGEAFNAAFSPRDDVELWLIPHNPFISKQDASNWEYMYTNTEMGRAGKIKILPWQPTQKHIASIMSMSTCGVFPSRAEGWNLEVLEMMALGKPVITTNYSAHTEFCDEYNALLIEPTNMEPAFDGKWFFEQGDWMEFGDSQMDQLIEYMKRIHKINKESGPPKNDVGIQTAQSLSWENSASILEKVLLDN